MDKIILADVVTHKPLTKFRCHSKTLIQNPWSCCFNNPVGSRFSVYQPAVLSPHSIRGAIYLEQSSQPTRSLNGRA